MSTLSEQAKEVVGMVPAVNPLKDWLATFRAHFWEIWGFTLVVTIAAAVYASGLEPLYRSKATLILETSSQKVETVSDIYNPGFQGRTYLATQLELLSTLDMAIRVVRREKLLRDPRFDDIGQPKRPWYSIARYLPSLSDEKPSRILLDDEQRELLIAETIQKAITAGPKNKKAGTLLIEISAVSKDPVFATQLANGYADAYIESGLDARLQVVRKASVWLTERIQGMKLDLEEAEQRLQQYRDRQKLIDVGGVLKLVESELANNTAKLLDARKDRTELENTYRRVQASSANADELQSIPVIAAEAEVGRAVRQMSAQREQVEALKDRYGPKHPKMIAARSKAAELQKTLESALLLAARKVRTKYELARDNERSLAKLVTQARGEVRAINRGEYELGVLERDVQTSQQLYDTFLTQFKQTDARSELDAAIARVVERARLPKAPFQPRIPLIVSVSFLLGLVLAFAFARLQWLISDGIKQPNELEALTTLPVLASLPLLPRRKRALNLSASLSVGESKSLFAESVRTLRTGVLLSRIDSKFKFLMVTSSIPGEGKTTVSINLASALGQMKKVLLIETDLRRPSIAHAMGLDDRHPGLADVILETATLSDAIRKDENYPFDVITSGQVPPNPLELLSSHRFKNIVAALTDRYQHIVFDSAPCQAVSDAYALASLMDGIVFVVRANGTRRSTVDDCMKRMKQMSAPLLGTVLNQYARRANSDLANYSYYYD